MSLTKKILRYQRVFQCIVISQFARAYLHSYNAKSHCVCSQLRARSTLQNLLVLLLVRSTRKIMPLSLSTHARKTWDRCGCVNRRVLCQTYFRSAEEGKQEAGLCHQRAIPTQLSWFSWGNKSC